MVACATALLVSAATGAAISAPHYNYPKNAHGQSFGKAPIDEAANESAPIFPDLVAVVGDDGKEGYVRSADLEGDGHEPATPEDAIAMQAKAHDRVLPVYESDGTTQIDTFTVWGPNHEAPVPPAGDSAASDGP